jgi:hypothetical protein
MVLPLVIVGVASLLGAGALSIPILGKFKGIQEARAEVNRTQSDLIRSEAARDVALSALPSDTRAARTESKTDDFLVIAKKAGPWVLLGIAAVGLIYAVSRTIK